MLHHSGSNQENEICSKIFRRNLIQRIGYIVIMELESHPEIVRHSMIKNRKLLPPLAWGDNGRGWCPWSSAASHLEEAEFQWAPPAGRLATGTQSCWRCCPRLSSRGGMGISFLWASPSCPWFPHCLEATSYKNSKNVASREQDSATESRASKGQAMDLRAKGPGSADPRHYLRSLLHILK